MKNRDFQQLTSHLNYLRDLSASRPLDRRHRGADHEWNPMSYKVEIIDEYSFSQWFSHHLRFATKTEAEAYSHQFCNAGWNGIQHLRTVASDEPVNAR